MCLYFFRVFITHEMTHVQHFCLPGFARASVHVADTLGAITCIQI